MSICLIWGSIVLYFAETYRLTSWNLTVSTCAGLLQHLAGWHHAQKVSGMAFIVLAQCRHWKPDEIFRQITSDHLFYCVRLIYPQKCTAKRALYALNLVDGPTFAKFERKMLDLSPALCKMGSLATCIWISGCLIFFRWCPWLGLQVEFVKQWTPPFATV